MPRMMEEGGMAGDTAKELTEFVGMLENWSLEVRFDPGDPASVEAAIGAMEAAIDTRAARYSMNPAVQQAAKRMKGAYRQVIREQKNDTSPDEDSDEET
ncbi:hypothetical protein RGI145_23795 (plasmid) [Roseomonas gilardii]|uniref:Uncharacterized protein n=2 Tax=Roseomonas gilardii TaxID=257708 RepID=A0A1L7ANL4_9PROT|nr:hypothetical protein RGI145_23795 [Roseomonas gilardii]